jgi:membrane-bound ClpP family serine protease
VHVTFDPLVLLTVLAFIIPWGDAAKRVRAAWFCLLAWRLRRRLERETGARVLVYVGRIERRSTFSLIRKIRATPPTRRLELVLDTVGGDPDAGRAVLHALASHPAKVVVRVPDECWSAGAIVAAGADEVVLAPDANLGPTDVWVTYDPNTLWPAQVLLAEKAGESLERLRSQALVAGIVGAITAARVHRGEDTAKARALAERLTMAPDHGEPRFVEDVKALGLKVRVDADQRWGTLVMWTGRSRSP